MFRKEFRNWSRSSLRKGVLCSLLHLDMSRNLKLRAVVFDLPVLIDKGADSEKRTERIGTKKPSSSVSQTAPPLDIPNVTTVQTKYMRKLRSIGFFPSEERSGASSVSDGAIMRNMNASVSSHQMNPAGRWLLVEGMGSLLDYLSSRAIRLGTICNSPREIELLGVLDKQLDGTHFDYKLKYFSSDKDSCIANELREMQLKSTLLSAEFLIVSASDEVLRASRDLGFYTCRYRSPQGRYGGMSTDYVATEALEVQDAVEDLVGIALRNSAYRSRFSAKNS